MHLKTKLEELRKEAARIEKQLAEEEAKLALLTPEQRVAEELHGMLCTWNHTDGCGWFWEFSDGRANWDGNAHETYLKHAKKLIHECNEKGIAVEDVLDHYGMVKRCQY